MKKIFFVIVSTLFFTQSAFAGKGYTTDTQPATCVDGDFWIDTNGATGERFYVCEEGSWVKSVGYGTSANPSFNSVHASGGNLAAANAQVTKKWITGLPYTANVTSVIYGGKHYICTSTHTADSTTEPGVGASWETVWSEVAGGGVSAWSDIQGLLTGSGTYVKADGTTGDPTGTLPTGTEGQTVQYGSGGTPAAVDLAPLSFAGSNISYNSETGLATMPVTATATSGSNVPLTSGGAYTALGGKQDADADLTTAAGATGAGNSKYFGTNSVGTAGFYDLPTGGSGSFTFDTFPAYEDSAHSSGIAVNGTTLAVYSSTAGKWLTVGLTATLNAAPVTYAATLTITDASTTGDTFTLNSIAYDAADSPVYVTNLPTATEQITYTGSNTAVCTGDVTGTGPWTVNDPAATISCSITPATATPDFYYAMSTITTTPDIGSTMTTNTGATLVTGYAGNGLQYPTAAGDKYISIGMSNIDLTNGTLKIWYKPGYSGTPSSTQDIVYGIGFGLAHNSSTGDLTLTYSTKTISVTGWNPTAGTWYLLTAKWDNRTTGLYSIQVDNETVRSTTGTATTPTTTYIMLARQFKTTQNFTLDEAKIWKSVLP